MIQQRKKTFAISINPQVTVNIPIAYLTSQQIEITYFTDSVYHSLVYPVPFTLIPQQKTQQPTQTINLAQIKMNFEFLLQETKVHRKIFDNIGVINIKCGKQLTRYGILITEEKAKMYLSLIE